MPISVGIAGVLSEKGTPEKECGIADRHGIVLDSSLCAGFLRLKANPTDLIRVGSNFLLTGAGNHRDSA
jgi:hypothetical protein